MTAKELENNNNKTFSLSLCVWVNCGTWKQEKYECNTRTNYFFYSMSWPAGQILLYLSISRARAPTNHSIHILFDCQFLDHFVFMLRIFFAYFFLNIYRRLALSLFCDSLRFYCWWHAVAIVVVVILLYSSQLFFFNLLSLLLNRFVFVAILTVYIGMYVCCVRVDVCMANTMFYIKIVEMTMISAHHTTNFRFRTCTATQYTNIESLFVSLALRFAFASSFIAFIYTQWYYYQYY